MGYRCDKERDAFEVTNCEHPSANALRAQASCFVLANKKEETEVSPD
jgi:hypothetical protein